MSPIVTLTWAGDVAYGPRGTRYELVKEGELYDAFVYSPASPKGKKLASRVSREAALLAAQADCATLTETIGEEADELASAGRTQLQRR